MTTLTTYFKLVGEPEDLARAVDVDRVLQQTMAAMGLPPEDLHAVELAWLSSPCRLEIKTGAEIDEMIQRVGGSCGGHHKGVTLTERLVWVLRLDWPGLVSHELCHAIQRVLGHPADEHEARRVADQVAP